MLTRRSGPRRAPGFTLIELVAAIVIVGAIAALAVPIFRDLRYDARKAALESIRMTTIANMRAARAAYLAQGGGTTVVVGGQSIAVHGEGAKTLGLDLPPGAPTAEGMYRMLGCGSGAATPDAELPCASLPGYGAWIHDNYLGIWPLAASPLYFDGYWCSVGYWPIYGQENPANGNLWRDPAAWDVWSGFDFATEYLFYTAASQPGGC